MTDTFYAFALFDDGSFKRVAGTTKERAKDSFENWADDPSCTFSQFGSELSSKGPINQWARDFHESL